VYDWIHKLVGIADLFPLLFSVVLFSRWKNKDHLLE